MVSIQSPISKKHSLSFGYANLNSSDRKIIKKAIKINKIKKRNKHVLYDIYNKSENDFIGQTTNDNFGKLKRNAYSFSQYEEDVIPKTQNNIERRLRRSESLVSESSYCKTEEARYTLMDEEIEKEDENSIEFQYGTLIGNEKVKTCVNNFLSNWSTFISDIDGGNSVDEESSVTVKGTNELVQNNSGYLTPISQKDDEYFSESSVFDKEDITFSENEKMTEEEEELFIKNSPIVKDNFDDICPFENDYYEDERMRNILNAEVLPNDYIGKIPYIPEKPMGNFGRLMKKYKF
jgi:hypothetical protein